MELSSDGWKMVRMPSASADFLASFENLPPDKYASGAQRFRRFSQFRIQFVDDAWRLKRLPHRPLIQSQRYNRAVGNVARHFEPLECDPASFIDATLKAGKLDTKIDWHLDVNQYRVIASSNAPGICVPEGIHQDGHQFVQILVFRRSKIRGAELSLFPLDSDRPFLVTTVQEGEAIIIDDRAMRHYATNITALEGRSGYRDYIGTCLNRWDERRYGFEFEETALSDMG